MEIKAIHTPLFSQDMDLANFIIENTASSLKEKSVLAITSKIISVAEGRFISKEKINKKTLIQRECEHYLGEINHGCHLTIQHGLLIPSAGIDESNSQNSSYILYPKDPFSSAEKLRTVLKKKLSLKKLALIITDSRTLPLRKGVIGVALAYSGFKAIKSLIGEKDLFGRPLKMTRINKVDALAAAAVLLMGEGAEQCPLALIHKAPLSFTDKTYPFELKISMEEDLYSPLYQDYLKTFKK